MILAWLAWQANIVLSRLMTFTPGAGCSDASPGVLVCWPSGFVDWATVLVVDDFLAAESREFVPLLEGSYPG